jgi:hypothetical protein
MVPRISQSTTDGVASITMADLAKARLGCIDPKALAELLQLTPDQRAQLMARLRQSPEVLRPDGTLPVEVGLGFTTAIKALNNPAC